MIWETRDRRREAGDGRQEMGDERRRRETGDEVRGNKRDSPTSENVRNGNS